MCHYTDRRQARCSLFYTLCAVAACCPGLVGCTQRDTLPFVPLRPPPRVQARADGTARHLWDMGCGREREPPPTLVPPSRMSPSCSSVVFVFFCSHACQGVGGWRTSAAGEWGGVFQSVKGASLWSQPSIHVCRGCGATGVGGTAAAARVEYPPARALRCPLSLPTATNLGGRRKAGVTSLGLFAWACPLGLLHPRPFGATLSLTHTAAGQLRPPSTSSAPPPAPTPPPPHRMGPG